MSDHFSLNAVARELGQNISTFRGRCLAGHIPGFEEGHGIRKDAMVEVRKVVASWAGQISIMSKTYEPLSLKVLEVIDGEMLGDGSLAMSEKNARFTYGTINREWTDYLREALSEIEMSIVRTQPETRTVDEDGKVSHRQEKYVWETLVHTGLTEQRKRWYPDGKKIVPRDLVLTPTVLLHWYIGDGSVKKPGPKSEKQEIFLHSNCFNDNDIDFLIEKLAGLGIEARANRTSPTKSGQKLRIVNSSIPRFFNVIGQCPVPSYQKKWDLKDEYFLCEEYPLSTGDVAKRLGVNSQTLVKWATGKVKWFNEAEIDSIKMWGDRYTCFSEKGFSQLEVAWKNQVSRKKLIALGKKHGISVLKEDWVVLEADSRSSVEDRNGTLELKSHRAGSVTEEVTVVLDWISPDGLSYDYFTVHVGPYDCGSRAPYKGYLTDDFKMVISDEIYGLVVCELSDFSHKVIRGVNNRVKWSGVIAMDLETFAERDNKRIKDKVI
jgi:hypothetical protein